MNNQQTALGENRDTTSDATSGIHHGQRERSIVDILKSESDNTGMTQEKNAFRAGVDEVVKDTEKRRLDGKIAQNLKIHKDKRGGERGGRLSSIFSRILPQQPYSSSPVNSDGIKNPPLAAALVSTVQYLL